MLVVKGRMADGWYDGRELEIEYQFLERVLIPSKVFQMRGDQVHANYCNTDYNMRNSFVVVSGP